jgi:hypothetical protein
MPSTRELFRTMWEVDQGWMPELHNTCAEAELAQGSDALGNPR